MNTTPAAESIMIKAAWHWAEMNRIADKRERGVESATEWGDYERQHGVFLGLLWAVYLVIRDINPGATRTEIDQYAFAHIKTLMPGNPAP